MGERRALRLRDPKYWECGPYRAEARTGTTGLIGGRGIRGGVGTFNLPDIFFCSLGFHWAWIEKSHNPESNRKSCYTCIDANDKILDCCLCRSSAPTMPSYSISIIPWSLIAFIEAYH